MTSIKYLRLLGILFVAGIFMVSCSKENEIIEEEIEEVVETTAELTINNRSFTYDAYALYCNENGKEFISVSNKIGLLGTEIFSEDLEEGDFMFLYANNDDGEYGIGGAIFTEEVTGSPFTTVSFTPDIDYTFETSDEATVSGSMSGDFLVFGPDGEPGSFLPFEVTYTAEIVGTSDECD